MRRTLVGVAAVLAMVVLGDLFDLGVTEARAQYVGVSVVVPGPYTRVRPYGFTSTRFVYGGPVFDPMVGMAAVPTYMTTAPVITTRYMAPVVTTPVYPAMPVYTRSYLAAPAVTVVQPRIYTAAPAMYGYPY